MAQHLPHPLPSDFAELIARRFAALGEPMRVRLLDQLNERGEASVQELAEALGASHANVSKHLNVLYHQSIVGRRKAGTRALYWIADDSVLRLCDEVCGAVRSQLRELAELVEPAAGAGQAAGAIAASKRREEPTR